MDDLSIKEFTRETLIEIMQGIKEAKDSIYSKIKNQPIAPGTVHNNGTNSENVMRECLVSFDIAVTATTNNASTKSGGIRIKVVEANLGRESKVSKEFISRIQFEVPFYPQCLDEKPRKL